ncbi:MAG: Uma2 family endonuclease [Planctomycetota bacterium]
MSVVVDVLQPVAEVSVPLAPTESLWRVSVEKYHQMILQGILSNDDPVELLEGLLVAKMTILPSHRFSTRRIRIALEHVVPQGWYVESPAPVTLAASEPEPDVAVVRGSDHEYIDRHPGPADVVLVVEVSGSSLRRDQGLKKAIYAKAGIPVYWIVNLIDRCVEVYTDPTGPAAQPDYRARYDAGEADQIPVVIEGREVARIAVREVLPGEISQ